MANTTNRKYEIDHYSTYDIKDWRKNIQFLQHLIKCIEGKKDPDVIDKTVDQLHGMIRSEKKIITEKGNFVGSKY